jgi:hypothetical protein
MYHKNIGDNQGQGIRNIHVAGTGRPKFLSKSKFLLASICALLLGGTLCTPAIFCTSCSLFLTRFSILGGALVIAGSISLASSIAELLISFIRKALLVKDQTAMSIIQQFCKKDGHAANYKEGRAKMIQLLVLQMNISSDQAQRIVNRLIKKRILEFTTSGLWKIYKY